MHVRVDVTRQNEFADAVDLSSERRRVLFAHRCALDLVAVDHHRRVRHHFAVGRVDYSSADQRKLLGVERDYAKEKDENDKLFHGPDVVAAFAAASAFYLFNPVLENKHRYNFLGLQLFGSSAIFKTTFPRV
jgi:hypothetical protein